MSSSTKPGVPKSGSNARVGAAYVPASATASPQHEFYGQASLPADRTAVMLEFQRTSLEMTRQFLETQQNVMLAYLRSTSGVPVIEAELIQQGMPSTIKEISRPETQRAATYPQRLPHANTAPARLTDSLPQGQYQATLNVRDSAQKTTGPVFKSQDAEASINSVTRTFAHEDVIVVTPEQGVENRESVSDGGTNTNLGEQINADKLVSSLIEIVSERTGYPPEMLDPTLDLEADLGIDSIKRVEILNSFRKLLPADRQKALESGIEQLAGVKTLQGIMDWIRNDLSRDLSAGESSVADLIG